MITIALYNLKGGVGKTTSAVNMAYLAAEARKRTVLWDWDPQAAASWYLGVDRLPKKAIKIFKKGIPVGAMEMASPYKRLTVIPADLSLREVDMEFSADNNPKKLIKKLVEPIGESASILIFDCPPTISPSVEYVLSGVDIVLVPIIPSPLSVRATEQIVEFFENKKRGPKSIYGFFNMVDMRRNLHKDWLGKSKELPLPMLKTYIPMDAAAESMGVHRAPLASYAKTGRAAQAYRSLWKELVKIINAEKLKPEQKK